MNGLNFFLFSFFWWFWIEKWWHLIEILKWPSRSDISSASYIAAASRIEFFSLSLLTPSSSVQKGVKITNDKVPSDETIFLTKIMRLFIEACSISRNCVLLDFKSTGRSISSLKCFSPKIVKSNNRISAQGGIKSQFGRPQKECQKEGIWFWRQHSIWT